MMFECVCALVVCLTVCSGQEATATATVTTPTTPTTPDGALLLEAEGQRLGELSKQVAETNRALEELLAAKLRDVHYASVVSELRNELDALRREVHQMRDSAGATPATPSNEATEAANSQKTLHWLQSSLAEVKSEIGELNSSVNVSRQMNEQHDTAGQLQLAKSDVSALQTLAAEASAERRQINQSIRQAAEDVQRLDQRNQHQSERIERLESDMADLRLEVQLSHKMMADTTEPIAPLKTKKNERKVRSLSDAAATPDDAHRVRHAHKHVKHEVLALRKLVKTLAAEQHDLQRQMVALSQYRITAESNVYKMQEELEKVLNKLNACSGSLEAAEITAQSKKLADAVERLAVRVGGVDQVQSSTLQLFEAMERLEERYDESIGELQREVSKLDFNDGQLTSAMKTLSEDQHAQSDQLKSLRATAGVIQEQVNAGQVRSALVLAKLTNNTLAMVNQSHDQQVAHWRLSQLEHSIQSSESTESLRATLNRLEREYDDLAHNLPHDCREVSSSGVNFVLPRGSRQAIKVYCDQETSGGGWTLVQRRTDGKEDFNRNWSSYKSGFGSVLGEFWLGNDKLHDVTKDNSTMLRVDLWDIYGQYWWAEYDSFLVANESEGYAVQFHGYTGNASDAMASYHQGMRFSTRDNDQDLSNTNCADSYQGGWWYSHCQHVNINGKYALGLTWYDSLENEWIALAKVEMKVRDKRIFSAGAATTPSPAH
uniref:EOG090X02LG n=1 Tax=Moina brachiata TaxID=675436 RepID=A0A4Y7NJY3_9CRUS|nr:EOG090X02LG [Moina brachiata]SVE92897.1 EOG090X02LG [Moina brachiata]